MKRCPYCGKDIGVVANECPHCGKAFRKKKPEQDADSAKSDGWQRSVPTWLMVAVIVFGAFCLWLLLSGGCENQGG